MAGDEAAVTEQARQAAETVLSFINTRKDAKGVERFGDAGDFSAWAREHGLSDGAAVTESEAEAARELRGALLTLLLAHSEHPDANGERIAEAERYLEHAGERYPVRVTLTAGASTAAGQNRGATGVFGTVLAAANELAQHGEWGRMKACCSHPCQHGFVDRTKNGAQRYCDSRCASREAMRTMRQRRREQSAD